MSTDFRALCAELVEALDTLYKQSCASPRLQTVDFDNRQRVAIPIGRDILIQDVSTGKLIAYARVALTEQVTEPPAPPAEGEVAELVRWLRDKGRGAWPPPDGLSPSAQAEEYEFYSGLTRAAELLERLAVPVPTFREAIQLAQGCHDYSGGYGGTPCAEAFHAGIGTVVNVLTKAASGPWDHQTQAVFAVGADLPLPALGQTVTGEHQ